MNFTNKENELEFFIYLITGYMCLKYNDFKFKTTELIELYKLLISETNKEKKHQLIRDNIDKILDIANYNMLNHYIEVINNKIQKNSEYINISVDICPKNSIDCLTFLLDNTLNDVDILNKKKGSTLGQSYITEYKLKTRCRKYYRNTITKSINDNIKWTQYNNYMLMLEYANNYKLFTTCFINKDRNSLYYPKIHGRKHNNVKNFNDKFIGSLVIKMNNNKGIKNDLKFLYLFKSDTNKYYDLFYNKLSEYYLLNSNRKYVGFGQLTQYKMVTFGEFWKMSVHQALYYYAYFNSVNEYDYNIGLFSVFNPNEIKDIFNSLTNNNNINVKIIENVIFNVINGKFNIYSTEKEAKEKKYREHLIYNTKIIQIEYNIDGEIFIEFFILIGNPNRYISTYNKLRNYSNPQNRSTYDSKDFNLKKIQKALNIKLHSLLFKKKKEIIKQKVIDKLKKNIFNKSKIEELYQKIKEFNSTNNNLQLVSPLQSEQILNNFFRKKKISQQNLNKLNNNRLGPLKSKYKYSQFNPFEHENYSKKLNNRKEQFKLKPLNTSWRGRKPPNGNWRKNPLNRSWTGRKPPNGNWRGKSLNRSKRKIGGQISEKIKYKLKFKEITKNFNNIYELNNKYFKYYYNNCYKYIIFLDYGVNNIKNILKKEINSKYYYKYYDTKNIHNKYINLYQKYTNIYKINWYWIYLKYDNNINNSILNKKLNIFNIIDKKFNLNLNKYNSICEINTNIIRHLNNYFKIIDNLYFIQLIKYYNFNEFKYQTFTNKYKNINFISFPKYFNTSTLKPLKKKKDIFISKLSVSDWGLYQLFFECINTQFFYNILLFFINNLNKNGIIIYYIKSSFIKSTSDIIILFKKYFKNIYLFNDKLINYKLNTVYVIFKGFKGITQDELNKLLKIFKRLYKNDPTSKNFNIKDKNIRNKTIINPDDRIPECYIDICDFYKITKPITKESVFKYPYQLLDLPLNSPEYDFIKKFNDNVILEKSICYYRLIYYLKKFYKKGKKKPKFVTENQFVNSYLYAIKYDLELIDLKKNKFFYKFYKNIEKLIVNNIYLYDKPTIYKFDDNIKFEMIIEDINKYLQIRYKEFTVMVKNIKELKWTQRNKKFYNDTYSNKHLIKLIKKKYKIKSKITDYWVNMYEIIKKCKLINSLKYYNYLYIGKDNEKENINVIETYIKNETKIYKYNIFNSKTIKKVNNKINLCIIDDIKRINKDKLHKIISKLNKTSKLVLRIQLPLIDMNIVELIQILYNNFSKVYLYKPVISNIKDLKLFEMYVICTKVGKNRKSSKKFNENFITGICEILNNMLFEYNKQKDYINNEKYLSKINMKKILKLRNDYIKIKLNNFIK